MRYKKYIIAIIVLFIISGGYLILTDTSEHNDEGEIDSIRDNCKEIQSRVNMRILPSCIIKGLKEQLNYTREEAYTYCVDTKYSEFCDEDIKRVYEQ